MTLCKILESGHIHFFSRLIAPKNSAARIAIVAQSGTKKREVSDLSFEKSGPSKKGHPPFNLNFYYSAVAVVFTNDSASIVNF